MRGAASGTRTHNPMLPDLNFYAVPIPGVVLEIPARFTIRKRERGVLETAVVSDLSTLKGDLQFMRSQRTLMRVLATATAVTY